MQRTIKPGDYIISKDKDLYRITNIESYNGNISYTIKSLNSSVEFIETYGHNYYRQIKGLAEEHLHHLGSIVPEEEVSDILNLLYKS